MNSSGTQIGRRSSLFTGIVGRVKTPFLLSPDLFIKPEHNEETADCQPACQPIAEAPSCLRSHAGSHISLIFSYSGKPDKCISTATGRIKHEGYEHVRIAFFFFFVLAQRHQSFTHGEDLCPFPLLFSFLLPLHGFYFLFFSLYVSILLIIHKCPLSLPFPFPLLSSPVAIIEPTTTSASSPGQYMSPCCTQNQKRGPAPHTNLSWKPLLHLWFVTIGWMECLLGVQLHRLSSVYLICTFIFNFFCCCRCRFFFYFYFWVLQPGWIYFL